MADLTTNFIPKAAGATQVDDSSISDDGTTVTISEVVTLTQSLVVGTPTGGSQGTGTVNASHVYKDGVEINPGGGGGIGVTGTPGVGSLMAWADATHAMELLSTLPGSSKSAVYLKPNIQIIRGGALTGVSDSPLGTASYWFQCESPNVPRLFNTPTSGGISPVTIDLEDATGTNYVSVNLSLVLPQACDGFYHNLIVSWDTNHTAGSRIVQVAYDGTLQTTTTFDGGSAAFAVDWTSAGFDVAIGHAIGAGSPPSFIGEVYVTIGERLDLSDSTNIDKFISGGLPVNLGSNGSTPTGNQPAIYMTGGPVAFSANNGSGGAFADLGLSSNLPWAFGRGLVLGYNQPGVIEVLLGTGLAFDATGRAINVDSAGLGIITCSGCTTGVVPTTTGSNTQGDSSIGDDGSGVTVGTPTGGGQGAGTVAAQSGLAITDAVAIGSLPGSPSLGMMRTVNDALAPAVGVAVAAMGAANALVWWNGTQWTVIGI